MRAFCRNCDAVREVSERPSGTIVDVCCDTCHSILICYHEVSEKGEAMDVRLAAIRSELDALRGQGRAHLLIEEIDAYLSRRQG